jgi:glycosyltransferase involved in cell wall biosynthesis
MLSVGAGNAEEHLHRLVDELGIKEHVTFTGLVSDDDWPLLHMIPSIYVMPSPNELQSIATLEAMASGKPIVSVDAGALGELCRNDENGYLVYPDDVKGMERAFQMLLDHPDRMKAFAKRSREIAETHDEKIVMPQFEELYKEVIEETRAARPQSPAAAHSAPSDQPRE